MTKNDCLRAVKAFEYYPNRQSPFKYRNTKLVNTNLLLALVCYCSKAEITTEVDI